MRTSAAGRAVALVAKPRGLAVRTFGFSLVFLGFALLLGTAAMAQSFRFSTISVEGNQRVEDGTILSSVGLAQGQGYSAAQLNDAYQALVDTGFFDSVEMLPSGARLTIKVVERPTINAVSFEGNSRLSDDDLTALIQSKVRLVFNPQQVDRDVSAITAAYREKGRISAGVSPKIIRRSDNRVDLVFEIAEGGVVEIERLSFVGNSQFSDARLRRILQTKQAGLFRNLVQRDTFVADRIAFDKRVLTDFYQSNGYVDFKVLSVDAELARSRDAYFLTFNVEEGLSYTVGNITVESSYPGVSADAFSQAVRLQSGRTYSPTDIDHEIERLEVLAAEQNIDFLRVEPRVTRNNREQTLDVAFVLTRGEKVFVERINIEGNTTTLDKVVRRQFTTVEGDPFNPREIREAAARIRALGFFGAVDVTSGPGTAADRVVLNVDVVERPTGSFTFGGNYNSASGLSAIASYKETNFLGRGQALDFALSAGLTNQRLTLDFTEPAFMDRDVSLGVRVGYSQTDNQNAQYDTDTAIFQPSLGFRVGDDTRLNLRYRLSADGLSDVDPASSAVLLAEEALGTQVTSALGYSLNYDNRSSGLNPDAGVVVRVSQDLAGFGGDTAYLSTTASASAQTTVLKDEVTLRATLEGGVLAFQTGDSRVTDRFFLGSQIMRGFEPNGIGPRDNATGDALGGNNYAVARLEANFPLGLPEEYGISGGVFYDIGSLWDVGNTHGEDIIYNDFTPRQIIGASLFWTTPIGPLRFNWTAPIDVQTDDLTQNFDLTISTDF